MRKYAAFRHGDEILIRPVRQAKGRVVVLETGEGPSGIPRSQCLYYGPISDVESTRRAVEALYGIEGAKIRRLRSQIIEARDETDHNVRLVCAPEKEAVE